MADDMSTVMMAKSDQINADDLVAGPITITITDVKIRAGEQQPVSMSFAGSDKVWRPCKTTGRLLMHAWGSDSKNYVGKSLTLFRDPNVLWGGVKTGGIRISHMSDIDRDFVLAVAESKQKRTAHTVKKLVVQDNPKPKAEIPASTGLTDAENLAMAKAAASKGTEAFRAWWNTPEGVAARTIAKANMRSLQAIATEADTAMADDPFGLPPAAIDAQMDAAAAAVRAAHDAEAERA